MKRQLLFNLPIPDGWRVQTVDEIKAPEKWSCVAGPFGSNISSKYFERDGIPVIRGLNLRDDLTRFVPEGFAFVSLERAKQYKAQHVKPNDLVFTCWGTLGQVGLIPEDGPYSEYIISNKQLKLRPNLEIADPLFLFYYFGSQPMVEHIRSIAIGAAVPGINLGLLKGIEVVLPPLKIQKRIASILSAYDALIENNTYRIKILEQMALMIYREWFVNFRFPDHEQVNLVPSEIGPIPSNWTVLKSGEALQYHIGGGWGAEQSNETYETPAHVIRGTDIPAARVGMLTSCPLRFHKESNVNPRRLQDGDIVFEVSGGSKGQPVGRALLVNSQILSAFGGDAICASFCKLLRPNPSKIGSVHLYEYLLESYTTGLIEKYQVQSTGITNFKFGVFLEDAKITVPSQVVRLNFERLSSPILDSIALLGRKNAVLRQTRDLLLPRLMSGEISVEHFKVETASPIS